MKYGYARVSTNDQSVEAQVRQLTKAGCKKVFRETASGEGRPQSASQGARSTRRRRRADGDEGSIAWRDRDLLNTLGTIADRKAGFRSLSDAWANTTSAHGRLMLTVLGGLAEFEHELIRTPDRRRTHPRQGPRCEDGPTAEDDAAPDQGGTPPPRCRRTDA